MTDLVLKAEGISKHYLLDGKQGGERVFEGIKSWFKPRKPQAADQIFWALQDVSFELKRGEVLGIIGKNGAGKSTLLNILSRITSPTKGRVSYKGRIASILDIGTGFHPDLSGRENIFLRGELLGMGRGEVSKKMNEILSFSGIEKFIDSPIKHYSSGMFLRLAFAVSMFLEADILLLDEVISVGDAAFRLKCFEKLEELVRSGVSIILVSHNFNEITSLCHRCIWIENGKIQKKGKTLEIIQAYGQASFGNFFGRQGTQLSAQAELEQKGLAQANLNPQKSWTQEDAPGNAYFKLRRIELCLNNSEGEVPIHYMKTPFSFEIEYEKSDSSLEINFYLCVFNVSGNAALSAVNQVPEVDKTAGKYLVRCHFPPHLFNHGNYYLGLWVGSSEEVFVESYQKLLYFRIECDPEIEGTYWREVHASVRADLKWEWEKIVDK